MKFQIDTTAKTIKIEDNQKLSVIIDVLEKILPNGEWKDFTLMTQTIIEHWHSPTIVEKYYRRDYPWYFSDNTLALNVKAIDNHPASAFAAKLSDNLQPGIYNAQVDV